MAIVLKNDYEWDNSTLAKVLLASVIPFGTFWVDKKYLR
jgi:integral membrane protein